MSANVIAQSSTEKKNNPLKFNLNQDGSHWVKANFLSQVWLRETQTNGDITNTSRKGMFTLQFQIAI